MRKPKILFLDTGKAFENMTSVFAVDYKVLMSNRLEDIKLFRPNIIVTKNYSKMALTATKSVRVVYLSDDRVFSGQTREYNAYDTPDAQSPIGKELIEVENKIANRDNAIIIRTTQFYDDILGDIVEKIDSDKALDASIQLYPIVAEEFARFLKTILSIECSDIIHVRGPDQLTEAKIGLEISLHRSALSKPPKTIRSQIVQIKKLLGVVLSTHLGTVIQETFN